MADSRLNQPEPTSLAAAQHTLLTADDLAKQPDDSARYELVKGVLQRMPPAGTAGCRVVWVINPRRETVEVYRSNEDFSILRGTDTLDGGNVVEGFQCQVQDIFA